MFIYFYLLIMIGSPIFYHDRPGQNNKIITIYKFKTVVDKYCRIFFFKKTKILKFCSFLRNTGLDELPQLLNVIKGDLSLVGPRPLLVKYLKINAFKNHVRNKCRPGITGLAQIETFNVLEKKRNIKWKKQFKLDKYYFYNFNLKLDIKILFLTLCKALKFSKKDYYNEPKLLKKYIK